MNHDPGTPDDFDGAFRRWAARTPATSPAVAAEAVVARVTGASVPLVVRPPSRFLTPARAVVALSAMTLTAVTVVFVVSLPPATTIERSSALQSVTVPVNDADLVVWLDDATPVSVFLPGNSPAAR